MSRLAPPHSYINVMDFNTTEELALYLHILDQDDELFAAYFWWRDFYTVKVGHSGHRQHSEQSSLFTH